jgi:Fur family transcriptional regulator, ferric uptake regulator
LTKPKQNPTFNSQLTHTMAEPTLLEKAKQIFEKFLLRQGSRKTPERYSVLEELYLLHEDEHIDVEGLFLKMRNKGYTISRATIYNTLDLLVESGLAVKHQFKNKVALYEQALSYTHHDHHVCNQCQRIREFSDPRLTEIKETMSREFASTMSSHALVLYGDCQLKDCVHMNATPTF